MLSLKARGIHLWRTDMLTDPNRENQVEPEEDEEDEIDGDEDEEDFDEEEE